MRSPKAPTRRSPRRCCRPRAGSPRRCWRIIRPLPNRRRRACASMTISDPKLRTAVDGYAEAIIGISIRERQISDIDKEVLGTEGRLIQRVTELLREVSARRGHVLSRDFARTLTEAKWQSIVLGTAGVLIGLVRRAAGGSPHRASAGIDRDLDPRGGGRRDRTPRSRRPMSTTRSATSPAPPKYSARRWSMPTPRARRRCGRWPNSGSPRKAIASCSNPRWTEFTSRRRAARCSTPIRRWRG